jgi:stress-induced morphogen
MITSQLITEKLKQLNYTHLDIQDTSSGCGESFAVTIVSDEFLNKPLLQRQ